MTAYMKAKGFFYRNAGFGYDPRKESRRTGKARCAAKLARAEMFADGQGWTCEWVADDCPCECQDGPHEAEGCILRDGQGKVRASLWGICGATAEYRRVVEAQLALEAWSEERKG